jgi:hypothetical protein
MAGLSLWYNQEGVTAMTKELEDILKQVEALPLEQQVELLRILEKKLSIPLQNPRQTFDDWDDEEVDKAYAETR